MKPQSRPRGRPPGVRFPRKLPVYDTEEGMALLQSLAQYRGISAAAVVRQLVREEARRVGILRAPASGTEGEGTGSDEAASGSPS